MSVWEDRVVGGGACTHALVIGISEYEHLPQGAKAKDAGPETLGLQQASTPAISAWNVARWLRDEYKPPDAPLATIRLLVAPSQKESDNDAELAALGPEFREPIHKRVKDAVLQWKTACAQDPANRAILYMGGHGIQVTKEGAIVLLQDFAKIGENALWGAIDLGSLRRSMSIPQQAQRQLFLIDACRIHPSVFKNYYDAPVGLSYDVVGTGFTGVSKVYNAASSGTTAKGQKGHGTLFSAALLECLRRRAVELGDETWQVSTAALDKHLPARVDDLARQHNSQQSCVPGGEGRSIVIQALDQPPQLPVTVQVEPSDARALAKASLFDGDTGNVVLDGEGCDPIFRHEVAAGTYTLSVRIDPPSDGYKDRNNLVVLALPPEPKARIVKVSQ